MIWCVQALPLAQTVFKVEADSLHLTLVGRFVYDVMHFVTEAREIASVLSAPSLPKAPQEPPADSYRPITEVCSLVGSHHGPMGLLQPDVRTLLWMLSFTWLLCICRSVPPGIALYATPSLLSFHESRSRV